MEAKSTGSSTWDDRRAVEGTSTMMPTVLIPAARAREENHSASAFVATIGAITYGSRPVCSAALASASSWASMRSVRTWDRRSPRRPRAGFSSAPRSANANGLSAPASRVRKTTLAPSSKVLSTVAYASVCSSIVGASCRSKKRNSVRNRPTPSAPFFFAVGASEGLPMLASTRMRSPSDSVASPSGADANTSARRLARSVSSETDASSGSTRTVPVTPSRASGVPSSMSRASLHLTTAGIPIWEARIAVWLVGPPAAVMRPRTSSGLRVAVSAGARSSATRITGESKEGTPGSGSPCMTATARSRTLRKSVTRSAR